MISLEAPNEAALHNQPQVPILFDGTYYSKREVVEELSQSEKIMTVQSIIELIWKCYRLLVMPLHWFTDRKQDKFKRQSSTGSLIRVIHLGTFILVLKQSTEDSLKSTFVFRIGQKSFWVMVLQKVSTAKNDTGFQQMFFGPMGSSNGFRL